MVLGENATKTYKASPRLQRSINLEAEHIATKVKSSDRIGKLPTNTCLCHTETPQRQLSIKPVMSPNQPIKK